MPRTCKNGQECRKYKAYENVDDKHVSIIQPILLVGLKEHRLMFCNTSNGRASMIRQLSPLTHVDNDETVIKTLTGKIPNLVQIYENINTSDHSNFFTSLQAFTQVICAVATVEGIN
nr:conserved Plasmodium protein, unknown function [Plasmodium sp. DRC-Itaito]